MPYNQKVEALRGAIYRWSFAQDWNGFQAFSMCTLIQSQVTGMAKTVVAGQPHHCMLLTFSRAACNVPRISKNGRKL